MRVDSFGPGGSPFEPVEVTDGVRQVGLRLVPAQPLGLFKAEQKAGQSYVSECVLIAKYPIAIPCLQCLLEALEVSAHMITAVVHDFLHWLQLHHPTQPEEFARHEKEWALSVEMKEQSDKDSSHGNVLNGRHEKRERESWHTGAGSLLHPIHWTRAGDRAELQPVIHLSPESIVLRNQGRSVRRGNGLGVSKDVI